MKHIESTSFIFIHFVLCLCWNYFIENTDRFLQSPRHYMYINLSSYNACAGWTLFSKLQTYFFTQKTINAFPSSVFPPQTKNNGISFSKAENHWATCAKHSHFSRCKKCCPRQQFCPTSPIFSSFHTLSKRKLQEFSRI